MAFFILNMTRKINTENERQGKNYLFEILVSVSLIIIFILVVITGLLSHHRLNLIIDKVKSGIHPDRKLILVKEIHNNITEAENNVKSFSLTRNSDYLVRFYELTENTGRKFEELDKLTASNDPIAPYLDTLNQLVGEKFTILDRLLSILDEFRVQQAMQQVVHSIREEQAADSIKATTRGPVTPQAVSDTVKPEEPVKKGNFFNRLFKKKSKPANEAADSLQPGMGLDTTNITGAVAPTVSLEKISQKVEKVQEKVLSRDLRERQEEWELLQQDKEIMKKIRQVIFILEEKEKANRLMITDETERKAGEVNKIIIAFGLTASVFILIAALVIYRYIRRNNEYKAVMERARKDAEELAKAKELFLASMSHEIRTPMNVISGFLDQVMKGPLDPSQAEQLRIIKKSSDHLLQLLNDLLDLSKLQADKLELIEKNFYPSEIIDDVINAFLPEAEGKKIRLGKTIDPSVPAIVCGDPVRLRQILFNLVGNAIKFTQKGTVTLKVYSAGRDPNNAAISFEVADTGIGMSEAELGKIYRLFEKVGTMAGSNKEGAGLGLPITKKLVELQGGIIRIESSPGKGTVFTVDIPYQKERENIHAGTTKTQAAGISFIDTGLLVVDDDEYNRRLAKTILQKFGCRIMEAGSAEEAIEMTRTENFDLVFMDVHLPGMKGPEAAREIKRIAAEKGKSIPVIAVSASVSKGDLENFRQSGIDEFILKPYTEGRLIEVIARFAEVAPHDHSLGDEVNSKNPEALYDLGPLKRSSGGSETFVKEMIAMFLKDTESGLSGLKELIDRDDLQAASELAHKMISPCRHLKADGLGEILKEIENIPVVCLTAGEALEKLAKARTEFERIKEDIMKNTDL
ncbi:MAG: response regulator [Bacteroidales bacterium]|nr:response regulator [Bacteroidales bacterium]